MKKLLLVSGIALVAAGCASEPTATADAGGDKEYRTGSNIPARSREGVHTMSPEDMERARNAGAANTGRKPGS